MQNPQSTTNFIGTKTHRNPQQLEIQSRNARVMTRGPNTLSIHPPEFDLKIRTT
jgi:hypothetical protein